uniref:Uncharacterized protein n=1 Tax=viral metagenome TaxID=1070528 RepID=A0A6C0BWX6_9ZZZZ
MAVKRRTRRIRAMRKRSMRKRSMRKRSMRKRSMHKRSMRKRSMRKRAMRKRAMCKRSMHKRSMRGGSLRKRPNVRLKSTDDYAREREAKRNSTRALLVRAQAVAKNIKGQRDNLSREGRGRDLGPFETQCHQAKCDQYETINNKVDELIDMVLQLRDP